MEAIRIIVQFPLVALLGFESHYTRSAQTIRPFRATRAYWRSACRFAFRQARGGIPAHRAKARAKLLGVL